jgi:hypothetical protein
MVEREDPKREVNRVSRTLRYCAVLLRLAVGMGRGQDLPLNLRQYSQPGGCKRVFSTVARKVSRKRPTATCG